MQELIKTTKPFLVSLSVYICTSRVSLLKSGFCFQFLPGFGKCPREENYQWPVINISPRNDSSVFGILVYLILIVSTVLHFHCFLVHCIQLNEYSTTSLSIYFLWTCIVFSIWLKYEYYCGHLAHLLKHMRGHT